MEAVHCWQNNEPITLGFVQRAERCNINYVQALIKFIQQINKT